MLALVWGPTLAPVVAKLIVGHPDLGRRLALAPPRAIHATAIFVHHALSTGMNAVQIGAAVMQHDLRHLLECGIRHPHPRLFGLLDRIGPQAMRPGFYTRLNTALHGPGADIILTTEKIDHAILSVVEAVVGDKVLLAAWTTIGTSESDARLLSRVLSFLRAAGLAAEIENLPLNSGWRAIARRVEADLGRARAPEPPFPIPEGWRPVATLGDLWSIGKKLANCVADLRAGDPDRLRQFMTGASVFVVQENDRTLLAAIQMVAPKIWVIDQMAGRNNGQPSPSVKADFHSSLAAHMAGVGHTLVEDDPLRAMISVAWRAQEGPLADALDGMFRAA